MTKLEVERARVGALTNGRRSPAPAVSEVEVLECGRYGFDPRVDYAQLARAEQEAKREFPQATRTRAGLSNGAPYVEVWTGRQMRTWTPAWAL